jgi:O-antigen ligase
MNQMYPLQDWIARLDRRVYAALLGLSIGIVGALFGLLLAVAGPIVALAAAVGIVGGLYILTDVRWALYGVIALMLLLPFGTLPFRIGFTPTLLDVLLVVFLVVYLCLWMTGQRRNFQITPAHILITLYVFWLIFAYVLGFRFGTPDATTLRQFAGTLLSISMVFILVDLLRDPQTLRRLVLVIMLLVTLQALLAIGLWLLNDATAEFLLVRLARIGYPDGGVIRYIESNPLLGERAIGTWVDPNALGGILAVAAALIAPQIFAQRPILRYRWLTWAAFGTIGLALFLTSSRASFLALAVALLVIVIARYRRYLPLLIVAGALLFLLPQTQNYVDRLFQAFRGEDLATQMRIGEWTDALELISQYPLTGIGFTGTPSNNVYTDVANMYLIMGNQIGITGIVLFVLAMSGVFAYGWRVRHSARTDEQLDSIHLGYHIALLTALVNAFADLYYFRLDFQASITWFWLVVALAIASSRLVWEQAASAQPTLD